ncbi:MAG: DUF1778 domain-containing protein [Gammaproteobacteria bacterium]|nr:DUF1778 domain-containing protein [Gammaproteobacteria bacterium]
MAQTNEDKTELAPINMRVHHTKRDLIDRAAKMLGKKRVDFIMEVMCQKAENVILDQRVFMLNETQYDEFMNSLDAPVADNPKLRDLMERKAPWE